jgi:hypothetical protein
MKVKVTSWKISTLFKLREKINAQPVYQRGEVWRDRKKALLIDSMLRGIDIPKVYLRKLVKGAYDYEVADGQQRLSAIFEFYENKFTLLNDDEKGLNLGKIEGKIVGGKKLEQLTPDFQDRFRNYEVSIAVIEDASNHEIRTLFGRLQEGEPLVPAEKRNAIISKVGSLIDNFAINHNFFTKSRIAAERFKRQDYFAHAVALIAYKNTSPLKAALLLRLYLDKDLALSQENQKTIANVLDVMSDIDLNCVARIYKKYHFIDVFWYLHRNAGRLSQIDVKTFADSYDELERKRLAVGDPEVLISGSSVSPENRALYTYYVAFKYSGAESENIQKRQDVFDTIFANCFK